MGAAKRGRVVGGFGGDGEPGVGGWVQGAKTAEEVLLGFGSEAHEAKQRLGPTPEDVSSRARVRSRTQPPNRL